MTDQPYTRADYDKAMRWVNRPDASSSEYFDQEAQAAQRILLALPEPAPTTFADLADEKRRDYWGCAVKNKVHGWKGWALSYAAGYVNVIDNEWLRTAQWLPQDTVLLPDQPRLHIPGYTTEQTPDWSDGK